MKLLLLTGDVISPQLLVSSDSKTRAVDFLKYAFRKTNNWRNSIVGIVGKSTEYTTVEEINAEQFKTIFSCVFLQKWFKNKQTEEGSTYLKQIIQSFKQDLEKFIRISSNSARES